MKLGIEPPKGVLLFGPPGTGKTLLARAVANRTDACFIRVIGSELVQKYVGEASDCCSLLTIEFSRRDCVMLQDALVCRKDTSTNKDRMLAELYIPLEVVLSLSASFPNL